MFSPKFQDLIKHGRKSDFSFVLDSYEKHEIVLIGLFLVFFALNILDAFSTFVGIFYYGFIELNPIGAFLIAKTGLLLAMIVLKSSFLAIIGVTIYFVLKETPFSFLDDDILTAGLVFLNALGFFVLSNNFGLLGWPFFFQFRF